ncbi:MAG: indole-3-glycerol phosphate synthase TrpC [archaeon]|nr:indole-3-glycerol phosphate synthase TrpC [archaeon]
MKFLEKMRKIKQAEIAVQSKKRPVEFLKKKLKKANHAFKKALSRKGIAIIAEFKKSSPSRGKINAKASLKEFVSLYDEYADAISVLTEKKFFSGNPKFLREAKRRTKKPVMKKDFIIDGYQIYEARYFGADAVLLIANMLTQKKLRELTALSESLGMDALVECDDANTLKRALASGSSIIGINNRNLNTMKEDFKKTRRLAKLIPKALREKIILVSESSINSRAQVDSLEGIVDAVLVGSAIMSARVPKVKLRELCKKTLVKICGTTTKKDAVDAVKLGADIIGLNFYPKSPRFVDDARAKEIALAIRGRALVAGVFVNEKRGRIQNLVKKIPLDLVQLSGNEKPGEENGFGVPVIKAAHVRGKDSVKRLSLYSCEYMMVDSFKEGEFGGTGKRFDEKLVKAPGIDNSRLFYSGGLNAQNVGGIIARNSPFAVDVCSGVEAIPGRKSFSKLKAFIRSVESAQK